MADELDLLPRGGGGEAAVQRYDAALAGAECHVLGLTDGPVLLPTEVWRGGVSDCDHRLLGLCEEFTLDIGCGPGRLTAGLLARGRWALGIDVSRVAVAMARRRGAPALLGDVFDPVWAQGRWGCALLADGNIGIGGDPVRLLRRVGELLAPGGSVVVELQPPGTPTRSLRLRLQVGDRQSRSFDWAVVGVDALEALAAAAPFEVDHLTTLGRRWVARLRRVGGASDA